MKHIGNLTAAAGSVKKSKRIGRGAGSGHGGTSTRGHKGHQSRSGHKNKSGFEGGQMPLVRRLPKFGFTNPFRVEYQVVNLSTIQTLVDSGRIQASAVTVENLRNSGVIGSSSQPVKILGNGDITSVLYVQADSYSASAKAKIESLGGTALTNG